MFIYFWCRIVVLVVLIRNDFFVVMNLPLTTFPEILCFYDIYYNNK